MTLRAPISQTMPVASTMSWSSWNSWPTRSSASRRLGSTRLGRARTPRRRGSAALSRTHEAAVLADALQRGRVEVLGHLARQRAGEHDEARAFGQVLDLLQQGLGLGLGDHGAVLDDLGLRHGGGVDHRRGGTRLSADVHEVVEDVLALQALDDELTRAPADEAGDDHRLAQRLERPGDVDSLAAREREALGGAVPEPGLEVGDGECLVDRGVGRDGDDHAGPPVAFAQKPAPGTAPALGGAQYTTAPGPVPALTLPERGDTFSKRKSRAFLVR